MDAAAEPEAPRYGEAEWWLQNWTLCPNAWSRKVPATAQVLNRATDRFDARAAEFCDAQDSAVADVFFVHPTLELFPGVANKDSRATDPDMLAYAVAQTTCFNGVARVYAPFHPGLQNLGAESGFRPRKSTSWFFLLQPGVQILYLVNQNQTPRSDSANLEP